MITRFAAVLISILAFLLPSFSQTPESLDMATRARYQRAIEEVFWRQRIWPEQNIAAKPPLDAMISPEQLQAKADDALRLTNALQKYWHQPISGQQLQAEIVRVVQNTKQPEVLRQLFTALDNRPTIIAEVLARPLLAARMARSFYEHDQRFSSKTQNFDSWWTQSKSKFSAQITEPQFAYVVPKISGAPAGGESWSPTHALPDGDSSTTAVWTGAEMIIWGGGPGKFNTGSRYNPSTDTWHSTNNSAAPDGRNRHTAVWTGTEMIVWGGCDRSRSEHQCESNDGARYNPMTDSWVSTTLSGVPAARLNHTAVWTGTEMIVWGGCSFINDACRASQVGTGGGRYNPSTNHWTSTNTANAPNARTVHTAIWTGSRMVVWGGYDDNSAVNTGAVYNPAKDIWTATATPVSTAPRYFHTAVWTGNTMIVWGGSNGSQVFSTGARYNPKTNKWRKLPTAGVPVARGLHVAVWTGKEMVVWAGSDGVTSFNSGGRFDPGTNSWKATSTKNAPVGRFGLPVAVWTGTLMVAWGGFDRTGGRYDPASDSWTPTNANEAPSGREWHTGVWTGAEMIVWGGDDCCTGIINTGGRYNLATDSWTPTNTAKAPFGRHLHTAVWTGTETIVWGGSYGSTAFKDGGRYNPVTDSWKPTKLAGAPEARAAHSAVWTGTEMIVFGGEGMKHPWLNTGGRYNPSTNSWKATSTTGAPTPRELPAAVWTGSEMIVWGGATSNYDTDTGARYDPATNRWAAITRKNAPSARNWSSAVWTGSKMLLWGGQTYNGAYVYHNDGALYDPASNTWTPTSMTNAPTPRAFFGYVWTGTELIAWGGCESNGNFCSTPVFTGGRYNPTTDLWTTTTTVSAPSGRSILPAVWTGNQMIVWGGFTKYFTLTMTGGVYTPGP